jgi:predicted ATPase/class 3 adenylate cyclase
MGEPPSGTVTLVFTDIEGSTRLLQRVGDAYADLLEQHRQLLRAAFDAHDGYEVDTEGDAFFIVFASANDAVAAAAEAQQALARHEWPPEVEIRVRVGVHTGEPRLTDGRYVGLDVHRAARVMAAGHGGQVLISQATHDLLDEDWVVRDLGEQRLKDLSQPQRLYQLQIEDLPQEFPALKTLGSRPTTLPVQQTALIGRERELEQVEVLLRREGVALLTLTGPGGTGKTRLALQVAADLIDDFPNGVFFVSLAQIRDPHLVVPAIAQTLGLREQGGEVLTETLCGYLRDKRMLLILDNFEQIVEAAPSVASLLSSVSELKVLVTSRAPLNVSGERTYPVPPLAMPDLHHLPDLLTLCHYDAVALFVERAVAAKPDFTVTNENAPAVAEICVRLDGLPLALELAAARVRALPPQTVRARLDQRLKLLTGGARDLDERQRTLRATIEWSYELLSDEEKTLFSRLSIFAGGCRLDAAEEVCDPDGDLGLELLQGITSLVEKSLLREREDPDGEPRFWMLETIGEYAREQLDKQGAKEKLGRRHLQVFLTLASTAEADLWAGRDEVWLPRFDCEQANFRAALDWAVTHDEAEIALHLAASVYRYWEIRARHAEARLWLGRALAIDGDVQPERRANALMAAGRAASWQADWPSTIALLDEAAASYRNLGDLEGIGRCLGFIGHTLLWTGETERAAAVLEEGVELARSSGDPRSIARADYNSAFAAIEQREFARARELFEEAATTARAEGMKVLLALALANLGYAATLARDYTEAVIPLNEAVNLFTEIGETTWTAVAFRYLGLLALLEGNIDQAEPLLRTSFAEGREQAPQHDVAYWIDELAAVAAAKGDTLRAAKLWGAADALFKLFGLTLLEENQQVRDRFRQRAEDSIDEKSWTEAWTEGHAMTLEQAATYALE